MGNKKKNFTLQDNWLGITLLAIACKHTPMLQRKQYSGKEVRWKNQAEIGGKNWGNRNTAVN
jgi:hypothetical protein